MSLIHQALERANMAFRPATENHKEDLTSPPETAVHKDENLQLEAFEKKIEHQKKRASYLNPRSVMMALILGAVIGGIGAMSNSLRHFDSEKKEVSNSDSLLSVQKDLPELKTPTKPVSQESSGFVLNGITTSGGERMALINNQIVTAGMLLQGNILVKNISTRHVILEDRGKEFTISL